MERDYRLASALGGAAGIVAVVFLATLALAGPRLGDFLGGGGYILSHQASHPLSNDDEFRGRHRGGGCQGPCDATPVHPSIDPSLGDALPVLGDSGQGRPFALTSDAADPHRQFDGSDPSFSTEHFGEGSGSGFSPVSSGGGGIPPGGGVGPPGGGSPPSVPEPAAWALFLIGAGAIGAALRASRPL